MERARETYKAKATLISKTSDKINNNPFSEIKQAAFKLGNLHRLATWCIFHHALGPLSIALTLPIVIVYMLQTGKYRVDESLLAGKWNDREGFPAGRSEAMFQLNLLDATDSANQIRVLDLVEQVLYGESQSHSTQQPAPGIPSTHDLAHSFTLDDAKAFCQQQGSQSMEQTQEPMMSSQPVRRPRSPHRTMTTTTGRNLSGKGLVVDFLTAPPAVGTAKVFDKDGLETRTLFRIDQIDSACAYLAANFAADIYKSFHNSNVWGSDQVSYSMMEAIKHNKPETIAIAHAAFPEWDYGDRAEYLETEQIHELALHLAGGTTTEWLTVGPLNDWQTYYERTVEDSSEHGMMHMMIVNTVSAFKQTPDSEDAPGSHWFLAAWYIEASD